MARPLSPNGHEFGVGITGLNFDPSDLADEAKAKEFIREQTGRTDLRFGNFSWLSYFRPNMRMVNKFSENRVFIVGDAAHVHSSTALYTHVVREVKDEATNKTEDENASGWFRWRNTALEMYGVNYRYSPIVLEERDTAPQDHNDMMARAYQGYEGMGTLRAGDRAPEAPGLVQGGTDTSLFTLFQPSMHTVLIFPHNDHASLDHLFAVTSACPKGTVQTFVIYKASASVQGASSLVDREGRAYSSYLIAGGTIVVVRPDGFIGAIVLDDKGLTRYFNNIFVHCA